MKKVIGKSLICLSLLMSSGYAVETSGKVKLAKSPIDPSFLSVENGGSKTAIDAYSDGIGMSVVGVDNTKIDNSKMNNNVFEFGDQAKLSDKSLKTFLSDTVGLAAGENLEIIAGPGANLTVVGTSCNDGNSNTGNDIYVDTNGTCVGLQIKTENKCFGDSIGSEFLISEVSYLVVDNVSIQANLDRADTLCTSNVTNMMYLFYKNTTFNKDISSWDVSHVTNMFGMFYEASSFNQDISSWNVSNVTDMFIMFLKATNFNQPLNSWDVSNVTNMSAMFSRATSFNQPLNNWNTSHVTRMEQMFYGASSFNQDLSGWNVNAVTAYTSFRSGSALTSANSAQKTVSPYTIF